MAASAFSASSCSVASSSTTRMFFCKYQMEQKRKLSLRVAAATSSDDSDCNSEECAPDKEVGKVSMEWLAREKTQVAGTYPPRKRGWTGYVEKDTAGQTNIYSVEPVVYVAESAISSGTAGSSSDGAENTLAIAGGLALIAVAAASSILLQVGRNPPPPVQTIQYSGPSLSYYINKFKTAEIIEASTSAPIEMETSNSSQLESSSPQVPQLEVQSESPLEDSTLSSDVSESDF